MIGRALLVVSSAITLAIGLLCISAGIYAKANSNFLYNQLAKLDLSGIPKAESMKKDIAEKFKESGIFETMIRVCSLTGCIIAFVSGLGLFAAITAWKTFIIIYLVVLGLSMAGFTAALLVATGAFTWMDEPLLKLLVELQDKSFVSVVALYNNQAGDVSAITLMYNIAQLELGCCGIRSLGDIRSSPRWQASPRSLAGLLNLRPNESSQSAVSSLLKGNVLGSMRQGEAVVGPIKNGLVPGWIKSRIPLNTTLPDGLNLPEKLPDGISIPKSFQIPKDLIGDAKKIEDLFESSLTLRTPITCCKLKEKSIKLSAKELLKNLEDHDCPFQSENSPGVHQEACYKMAIKMIDKVAVPLILAGIFIALLVTCNVSLAAEMLLCG